MTRSDVLKLTAGDKILFRRRGSPELEAGFVSTIDPDGFYVNIRRPGCDSVGRKLHTVRVWARRVHVMPLKDRLAANVYADWLDEVGESRAAAKLRLAFPLDDGTKGG